MCLSLGSGHRRRVRCGATDDKPYMCSSLYLVCSYRNPSRALCEPRFCRNTVPSLKRQKRKNNPAPQKTAQKPKRGSGSAVYCVRVRVFRSALSLDSPPARAVLRVSCELALAAAAELSQRMDALCSLTDYPSTEPLLSLSPVSLPLNTPRRGSVTPRPQQTCPHRSADWPPAAAARMRRPRPAATTSRRPSSSAL